MEIRIGQRVKAKAGHPFAVYGEGIAQTQGFDGAFEVAFPIADYAKMRYTVKGGDESPVLRLWIQGKDIEVVTL